MTDHLSQLTVAELWELWRDVLAELRSRNVLRTTGGPVGDYGEFLVARAFELERANYPNPAWDAKSSDGVRYSIKARRWGRTRPPTRVHVQGAQAGAFDRLVFVLFDDAMSVIEAVDLSCEGIRAVLLAGKNPDQTTVRRLLDHPNASHCEDRLRAVQHGWAAGARGGPVPTGSRRLG